MFVHNCFIKLQYAKNIDIADNLNNDDNKINIIINIVDSMIWIFLHQFAI